MKTKRFFAILLTLCMILTALPSAAFADDPQPSVVTDSYEEDPIDITADPPPASLDTVDFGVDSGISAPWDGTFVTVEANDYVQGVGFASDPFAGRNPGSGTQNDPYLLSSAADLKTLSDMTQNGAMENKLYFRLLCDVDLSAYGDWKPIGPDDSRAFKGEFDGGGCVITGLSAVSNGANRGLFGVSEGAIKNLTVVGTVCGDSNVGGIVGKCLGPIENCTFTGDVKGGNSVGGIVGRSVGNITNCAFNGNLVCSKDGIPVGGIVLSGSGEYGGGISGICLGGTISGCRSAGVIDAFQQIGGIAGRVGEEAAVRDCVNEASLVADDAVGGIAGLCLGLIADCVNNATIYGYKRAGGIVGQIFGLVTRCRNTGKIEGMYYSGGIAGGTAVTNVTVTILGPRFGEGWNGQAGEISYCVNEGDVGLPGTDCSGGISGWGYIATLITGCENRGSVEGKIDCGGIVGYSQATVTGCVNTGRVKVYECDAGGIAGRTHNGTIAHCVNEGDVECAKKWAGGIVGRNNSTVIQYCINKGTVLCNDEAGGIVGYLSGHVTRCVSFGEVRGSKLWPGQAEDLGSVSGYAWDATIEDCYLDCKLGGNTANGALFPVGRNEGTKYSPVTVRNNYSATNYLSINSQGTFSDEVWYDTGDKLWLRNMSPMAENGVVTVRNAEQLECLARMVNHGMDYYGTTILLDADLDLEGIPFEPIAHWDVYDGTLFKGNFAGQGHTISNLTIDQAADRVGLFGYIKGGSVKNLKVNGTVTGEEETGGLVGRLEGGSVENCSFTGNVSGTDWVGGLVGYIRNYGLVKGCSYIGGSVTGSDYVGGIAGQISQPGRDNDGGRIEDSCSVGAVTGGECVGGCLGDLSADSHMKNCYHYTGAVTGSSKVGALVGDAKTSKVFDCFYLTGTAAKGDGTASDSSGHVSPLTADRFIEYSSFPWSFGSVWSLRYHRPVPEWQLASVTLDANGGTGTMAARRTAEVPPCAFTRDGYDFIGWATDPALGGEFLRPGDPLLEHDPVTLYAVWGKPESVGYVDGTGAPQSPQTTYVLNSSLLNLEGGSGAPSKGWYSVDGILIDAGRIEVSGDVNLILKDGTALIALGGIHVPAGSSLTVYGQENLYPARGTTQGTGTLIAQNYAISAGKIRTSDNAAIGGNDGEPSGNITIHGGIVSASAQGGAAIGGGRGASSGVITVINGHVNAQGGSGSAAIGGGMNARGGTVAIEGGVVVAVAGSGAQAVGSGRNGASPAAAGIAAQIVVYGSPTAEDPVAASERESVLRGKYARIEPVKLAQELAFATDSVQKELGDADFTIAAAHTAGDGKLRYSSSDTGVATVDADGKVRLVGEGEAVIRAAVGETVLYKSAKASYTLTVTTPKEPVPDAVFTATGPDSGTLSNLDAGASYTVGGAGILTETAIQSDSDGSCAFHSGLAAGPLSVVKNGGDPYPLASDAQTLTVAKAATPALIAVQPDTINGTGSIPTTAGHQKSINGTDWEDADGAWTGLVPGTYYVRVKASGSSLASDPQTITITDFDPNKEPTPAASFTATGPDSGVLSGLTPDAEYAVGGAGIAPDTAITAGADGSYAFDAGLAAGDLSVVKKGNGSTTLDSGAQTVTVSKAASPAYLASTGCTTEADDDGTITGTDASMEYRAADGDWTPVAGTSVTGLSAGTYSVRVKADGAALSSDPADVTVAAYVPPVTPDPQPGNDPQPQPADDPVPEIGLQEYPEPAVSDEPKPDPDPEPYTPVSDEPEPTVSDEPEPEPEPVVLPEDVNEEDYYYGAVSWAYENAIAEGRDETTFDPDGKTSRAEMVTFLWRAAGKPEPSITECPFTDVDPDDFYCKAVLWAYENGITEGVTATLFDPDGIVSRAMAVTFLFRAIGMATDVEIPFTDVPKDAYYAGAVRWAYANGVTEGVSDTSFDPDGDCLRSMAVTFLFRAYGKDVSQ